MALLDKNLALNTLKAKLGKVETEETLILNSLKIKKRSYSTSTKPIV